MALLGSGSEKENMWATLAATWRNRKEEEAADNENKKNAQVHDGVFQTTAGVPRDDFENAYSRPDRQTDIRQAQVGRSINQ